MLYWANWSYSAIQGERTYYSSIEEKQKILFEERRSLPPANRIYNRMFLESVDTEFSDKTMNKENGFVFSDWWKILLRGISKSHRQA